MNQQEQIKQLEKTIEILIKRIEVLEEVLGIKDKKDQVSLFAEPEKTIFRESQAAIKNVFNDQFKYEIEAGIDMEHYYNITMEWSDKLQTRTKTQRDKALRTNNGWISTVRGMMRKDNKIGKLKMLNDQKTMSQDEKEYLMQMSGAWK